MTDQEITTLKEQFEESATYYTALFSIKEALSKVLKTGMMLDFKILETKDLRLHQGFLECHFTHFGQYKGFVFFTEHYVVAVVLPARTSMDTSVIKEFLKEGFL